MRIFVSKINSLNKAIWQEAERQKARGEAGTLRQIYFRLKNRV